MDARQSVAEAVAAKGGRIVAVGNTGDIRSLAANRTREVNLAGNVMLPGLYAPHCHFTGSGELGLIHVDLNAPPIGTVTAIADIQTALRERAEETPDGDWIQGRGYDDTLLAEQRHPTRHDLDQISTTHPILIVHTSGHLAVANSRALEIAEVTNATPDPPGGRIRRETKSGEPNGVLEECRSLISPHIPALTEEQRLAVIRRAAEQYASRGVTTACSAGGGGRMMHDLLTAARQNLQPLRMVAMSSRGGPSAPAPAEQAGILTGHGSDMLRQGAIKMLQDGSIQGYTGYLTMPYYDTEERESAYRGYPARTREELTDMVCAVHRAGYQVAIHGNGDAAIDDILHAYECAQTDVPREDARHRIEHCQTAREDQLAKMQSLGVTPSFFVAHIYYWGDRHRDIFLGPERAARISPLRSALDHGLRFTLHEDTPVTPVDPLLSVWAAVNRQTRRGEVLGPDQCLTAEEALRSMTIDAAWQNLEESIKGSVEPGKLADFTLVADNPLHVSPQAIKDIPVIKTIVGDHAVWSAQDRRYA